MEYLRGKTASLPAPMLPVSLWTSSIVEWFRRFRRAMPFRWGDVSPCETLPICMPHGKSVLTCSITWQRLPRKRALWSMRHAVNSVRVLTTRKSMPGAKDLLTCAVMAGGAFPHRLGLSETVLVFDQHLTFFGGFDRFLEELPRIKARCVEKEALRGSECRSGYCACTSGAGGPRSVDGVQLDKVPWLNWMG